MTFHSAPGPARLFAGLMLTLVLALPAMTVSAPAAYAQQSEEAANRIVIAGRQRMLAEGMAAKLCLASSGVRQDESVKELYVMWNIFTWYHRAIHTGNVQLGLRRERASGVLDAWSMLDGDWRPLAALYEPLFAGRPATDETLGRALIGTDEVTGGATSLVAALRSAYADDLGPRGFGSALLLDLYERQRMLAHKIAKDVCLVARGTPVPDLAQTVDIFVLSLQAFRAGMADAGVVPPPTPEIAAALGRADAAWAKARPLVEATVAGHRPDRADLTALAPAMDRVIVEMTTAINGLISVQGGG